VHGLLLPHDAAAAAAFAAVGCFFAFCCWRKEAYLLNRIREGIIEQPQTELGPPLPVRDLVTVFQVIVVQLEHPNNYNRQ